MKKKVLSEQSIIYGDVSMPKGFEIDKDKLITDTLESSLTDKEFPFSRTWDMLNTYIKEHVGVEYGPLKLYNKKTWSDTYNPDTLSKPLINIDYSNLGDSPDIQPCMALK